MWLDHHSAHAWLCNFVTHTVTDNPVHSYDGVEYSGSGTRGDCNTCFTTGGTTVLHYIEQLHMYEGCLQATHH